MVQYKGVNDFSSLFRRVTSTPNGAASSGEICLSCPAIVPGNNIHMFRPFKIIQFRIHTHHIRRNLNVRRMFTNFFMFMQITVEQSIRLESAIFNRYAARKNHTFPH